MHGDALAAADRLNELVTLDRVELLHSTDRHARFFSLYQKRASLQRAPCLGKAYRLERVSLQRSRPVDHLHRRQPVVDPKQRMNPLTFAGTATRSCSS
jgi:hypothetical protein